MAVTSTKASEHIWFTDITKCCPFWQTKNQISNKDCKTNDYYDDSILILLVWAIQNLYF